MPAATDVQPFPAGFRTEDIQTNGTTLYVRIGGQGPAVILLHGYGETGDMWASLAADLAHDHTIVAPDLRGMGLSVRPASGYDKKTQGRDVAGVLDAVGIERVDLVTHDIGNMVGYAFAAQYPDLQKSHLVVIPCRGSQPDAELAAEQIALVKMQERVAGRAIPYAVLFTQTRPTLNHKTHRFIEAQFAELGAPIFDTQIVDREAYRAMFSFGGSLAGLKDKSVGGLPAALANAHAFTQELVHRLRNGNKSVNEAA
jgi:pimeloyl-ACP methyl ester carboxylesterase